MGEVPAGAPSYEAVAGALKDWRNQQAGLQRTERYMVVSNRSLAHLAARRPETPEALLEVPGIGPAKAADYGYVLTRYFRELSEGKTPETPLLVSSPIPEGLDEPAVELLFAVRTLEGPLEEMARRRELSLDTLTDRIAALVDAGALDVVHILCSPLEVHLVAEAVREGERDPEALAGRLPSVSPLARLLVPRALAVQEAGRADASTEPS